jgi:hypothetical protein
MINVKDDYGAKGDGVTDDTAAINNAIAASGADAGNHWWQDKPVYFPIGTYMVSSKLFKSYGTSSSGTLWASGMILIGESKTQTIIRLTDNAPGYGSASSPQPVIFTTSKNLSGAAGTEYYKSGAGNDAYENSIDNMTVDVGHGNPGAIAIDYLANNLGAIRDVTVTAPSGSGAVGISMIREWIGPALLERVTVSGFAIGINVGNYTYCVDLDNVTLNGQTQFGLQNDGNFIAGQAVNIGSVGPAINNTNAWGQIDPIIARSLMAHRAR